ncbi:hypothetical protein TrST_g7650 [Triparma strigata]|uniref:Trafficking protein particle complex subunit 11 domain-containing protein n=1 Tax=Triparma strigata TaxID=1606541 RepID=A0A9W7AXC5_9STRA|nr:hypothetical protein TrST_g7650 [Triparma strigata]
MASSFPQSDAPTVHFATPFSLPYPPSLLFEPTPFLSVVDGTAITTSGSSSARPASSPHPSSSPPDPLLSPPLPLSPFSSLFERFFSTLCSFDRPIIAGVVQRNPKTLVFRCSQSQADFKSGRIVGRLAPSRRVGGKGKKEYLFPRKKSRNTTNGDAQVDFGGQSVEVGLSPPISSPGSPANMFSSSAPPPKPPPSSFHVLPESWLRKHLNLLPSHVLIVVTFDSSIPHNNWTQMEINVQDLIENTRASLSGRDSKVHLVVLKLGTKLATASMSPSDAAALKALENERLSSLKNRCGLSSNLFTTLASTTDIDVNHATLKKLWGNVKAASKQYYLSYARRYKKREKSLSANTDVISLSSCIRFSYKVAAFYEFLSNRSKALKWYQGAYNYFGPLYREMMVTRVKLGMPVDAGNQVRGGADWINHKLVSYALQTAAETNSVRNAKNVLPLDKQAAEASLESSLSAAVDQWRRHAALFMNKYLAEGVNGLRVQSKWSFYAYVFKQRSVMGVLTENLRRTGYENDTSQNGLYAGTPWSYYYTAAEALLSLHRIGGVSGVEPVPESKDDSVGGDKFLREILSELKGTNLLDLALNYVERAMQLLEGARDGVEGQAKIMACRYNYTASLINSAKGQWVLASKHAKVAVEIVDESWSELAYHVGYQLFKCRVETGEDVSELAQQILLNPCHSHLSQQQLDKVKSHVRSSETKSAFDNDKMSPFEFYLTFPVLYAIAGDTVDAKLMIRSNVPSLEVSKLKVKMDFDAAINVNLGEEGLKFKFGEVKSVDVQVPIPSNLGNRRGSLQAGGLTPSVAKVEKPLNSGFTRAGGACMIMESSDLDDVMGGAPVGAESCTCVLANGHSIAVMDERATVTPTAEEANLRPKEDYLTHSWAALSDVGVEKGPKVLRVHGPLAQLRVEDITSVNTDGRAIDGAVFRVVLKISAGAEELCKDVSMEMSCANAFLSNEQSEVLKEHRRAMLVEAGEGGEDIGLPEGWRAVGGDGSGTSEAVPITDRLDPGAVSYVAVHLYRPPPAAAGDPGTADIDKCITEWEVVFSYTQILRGGKEKQVRRRCQAFLEWGEPIRAALDLETMANSGFPAGITHPSNLAKEKEEGGSWERAGEGDNVEGGCGCVVSDQSVKIRCTLGSAMPKLPAKLEYVKFGTSGGAGETSVKLVEIAGRDGVLYKGCSGDLSILRENSRIGISYVVTPSTGQTPVKTNLGSIKVKWSPLPMDLPSDVKASGILGDSGIGVDPLFHGPLPSAGAEVKIKNPTAIVERPPFHVDVDMPSECKLGEMVKVVFKIKNLVKSHQRLGLKLTPSEKVFVDGKIIDTIYLNGLKEKTLEYNVVFLEAGASTFPSVSIVDLKKMLFVVNEETELPIYVHA